MQHPAQVLEVAVVEKDGGVGQDPAAQRLHAHRPDLGHPVPVAVHKHALKDGVHDGTQLCLVLQELCGCPQHTHTQAHTHTQHTHRGKHPLQNA